MLVVGTAAITDLRLRRRIRALLDAEERRDPTQHAFGVLLAARSRFTTAVASYEQALSRQGARLPVGVGVDDVRPGDVVAEPGPELLAAEQAKDRARTELLDAQRLWAAAREHEHDVAEPTLPLWTARGVLVGANLGPVGWEHAVLRYTHLLDDDCWAVYALSRPRFGLALGAEVQRLGVAAAGVGTDGVESLTTLAFSGPEAAARPGLVLGRRWRWFRRSEPTRSAVAAQLADASVSRALDARSTGLSEEMRAAYAAEFGVPITPDLDLGLDRGLLGIHTKGPSLLLGAWTGPRPRVRLVAASNHAGWKPRA